MKIVRSTLRVLGTALLFTLLLGPCRAADDATIMELKRAVDALREENRSLTKRLEAVENKRAEPATAAANEPAPQAAGDRTPSAPLEQRVRELEMAKTAQEGAVRSIIQDTIAIRGPKINESTALGGTLTMGIGRTNDFSSATRTSSIGFGSADFEFEYQMNNWSLGTVRLEYDDGRNAVFTTTNGAQASIDRINVDVAHIAIGNQLKFPPLLMLGRMVLPFGTTTGRPVADALSVASPLTSDVFEMRENAISLNLRFPTPKLRPPTPPVVAPPVTPKFVYPMLDALGRRMGYDPPPTRPKPLAASASEAEPGPFDVGIFFYDGKATGGIKKHIGGSMGYQTKGNCGRRYEELPAFGPCPWAINADVSYVSSVFDSRFLQAEYSGFLQQIGRVPGMAASVKASLGPFALVSEWTGATRSARFVDDAGRSVAITPSAWQLALGYQFGWNPWVREIGKQGSYFSIGYSQSRDLAGVTRRLSGEPTRVGLVPKRRLLLTVGEWSVDGVRLAVEYAKEWDYTVAEGGTGRSGSGISASLTYAW